MKHFKECEKHHVLFHIDDHSKCPVCTEVEIQDELFETLKEIERTENEYALDQTKMVFRAPYIARTKLQEFGK